MSSFLQGLPNKKRILFLVLMSLLLISGALLFNRPEQTKEIHVSFPSGRVVRAEVADTPEKLLFGLAFRNQIPDDGGMLFIFEESSLHQVWTKEFRVPVDIIWIDESKKIVYIVEEAPPCSGDPCTWYGPPPEHARYVLETNAGFVKEARVEQGMQLKFILRM
ncbi:MAG: DUF192 domain-containing protein [Nitrospira sp.]|nr:DUF192 domain-containing protein [Nitrospira sp.]